MSEIYKNLSLENLEGEEWRDIPNYEGLYQVSNLGRVKSLGNDKTKKEKIRKQGKNHKGYLNVNLCKEGKRKNYLVHRIVCQAFIENTNNFRCVNHKDENKENNQIDNLEWCDNKYNSNYGTSIQRRVEKQSKQVYQYDKNGTLVSIWESTNEVGRNGFNQGNVTSCCNGNRKSHKGFKWSYEEINQK